MCITCTLFDFIIYQFLCALSKSSRLSTLSWSIPRWFWGWARLLRKNILARPGCWVMLDVDDGENNSPPQIPFLLGSEIEKKKSWKESQLAENVEHFSIQDKDCVRRQILECNGLFMRLTIFAGSPILFGSPAHSLHPFRVENAAIALHQNQSGYEVEQAIS